MTLVRDSEALLRDLRRRRPRSRLLWGSVVVLAVLVLYSWFSPDISWGDLPKDDKN